MKKKQKQNQLQKRSQNAQKQGKICGSCSRTRNRGAKTAFDAKSTSPDAALIEAANALAAEGDVTGAIESDAGVYVAKLTSLLDREATDQKKASIIEERKQEQYDSLLKNGEKKQISK